MEHIFCGNFDKSRPTFGRLKISAKDKQNLEIHHRWPRETVSLTPMRTDFLYRNDPSFNLINIHASRNGITRDKSNQLVNKFQPFRDMGYNEPYHFTCNAHGFARDLESHNGIPIRGSAYLLVEVKRHIFSQRIVIPILPKRTCSLNWWIYQRFWLAKFVVWIMYCTVVDTMSEQSDQVHLIMLYCAHKPSQHLNIIPFNLLISQYVTFVVCSLSLSLSLLWK